MSKKAFTLVELLVVVAIIAILASALLVGLGGARQKARDARRIADLRNVQSALEVYYARHNEYPTSTSWADLENDLNNAGITSQLPGDPLTGTYDYVYCDNAQRYVIRAQLESSENCPPNYSAPSTINCNQQLDCDCLDPTKRYVCFSFK